MTSPRAAIIPTLPVAEAERAGGCSCSLLYEYADKEFTREAPSQQSRITYVAMLNQIRRSMIVQLNAIEDYLGIERSVATSGARRREWIKNNQ